MPRHLFHRSFALALGLIAAGALASCSVDPALRAARAELPRSLAGVAWPTLLPIEAFARSTPARLPTDPASLAARAASLRARAAVAFAAPVLSPERRAALIAALNAAPARNGQ